VHDRGYDDLPRRNGSGRNSYDRLDRDAEGWGTVVDPYGSSSRDWQTAEEYAQQTYHSMAMLATTLDDGAWLTTGLTTTEDYCLKTDVVWKMGSRGWRDNGQQRFVSDSGWTVALFDNREAAPYLEESRPEELPRNWETCPRPGNRTKTIAKSAKPEPAQSTTTGATATPTSLVASTITTTAAVIGRGRIRARSGKIKTSSEGIGSTRMIKTPTSLCFIRPTLA